MKPGGLFAWTDVCPTEAVDDYEEAFDTCGMKTIDYYQITDNVLRALDGDKINEISVAGIINELMMGKLFNLNDPKLKGLLENLDYTDEKFSEKYKKDLKNVTGIDPDICGKGGGLTFNGDFSGEYVILENENNFSLDDSWKKISLKNDIYYSDILSTYVLFDKNIFNEFLRDIKNKLIKLLKHVFILNINKNGRLCSTKNRYSRLMYCRRCRIKLCSER